MNRKKFTSLDEILKFSERDEKLKNLYIVLSLEDRFQETVMVMVGGIWRSAVNRMEMGR